jgi:hypothetical protein
MSVNNKCLRCDQPGLKTWDELTDEEREVVKRLPASADYTIEERKRSHRWCTRCWNEVVGQDLQDFS